MITRRLEELLGRSKKSVLLLGPRQTGKSTLAAALGPDLTINLAHEATFLDFARNPSELEERLGGTRAKRVLIDEVQRLPSLLNTVQALLDSRKELRFILTGSSARKLKRGQANLLPGRIHTYRLGALVAAELAFALNTEQALSTGTLPGIYLEEDPREQKKTLRSYAATYLKEEIQAEALTRRLEGFARLLYVAAAEASHFLDLTKLASEAQIPRQSASRYFEILEETLVVRRSDAFGRSARRRLIQHPRYFFFDTGVLNALMGNFAASVDRRGVLFEHLVFNQIVDSAASLDLDLRISSYRTEHGAEVDFIVELEGQTWAIEVKASTVVSSPDTRGFTSFCDYFGRACRKVIVYLGKVDRVVGHVAILPWQRLLQEMEL